MAETTTFRVCVSSTFRNLKAERTYLYKPTLTSEIVEVPVADIIRVTRTLPTLEDDEGS